MATNDWMAYDYLTPKQKRMLLQDLPRRLKDPKNPAGNYTSPGGPVFNVNTMNQAKAPKPDDKSKIASLTDMTIAHHTKLKPWQQNRKNQYDMMLQNDMMHPKDYEKHMKRHKIDPEHWLNFS